MNKRTKYLLAALAVIVIVSNIMLSSKARAPKHVPTIGIGPDFYESIPSDVVKLREDFERELTAYEEMMKPFNSKLDDLADDKLPAEETEELLSEVELKTGPQEMKVNDLKAEYAARMKELRKAYSAKRGQLRR